MGKLFLTFFLNFILVLSTPLVAFASSQSCTVTYEGLQTIVTIKYEITAPSKVKEGYNLSSSDITVTKIETSYVGGVDDSKSEVKTPVIPDSVLFSPSEVGSGRNEITVTITDDDTQFTKQIVVEGVPKEETVTYKAKAEKEFTEGDGITKDDITISKTVVTKEYGESQKVSTEDVTDFEIKSVHPKTLKEDTKQVSIEIVVGGETITIIVDVVVNKKPSEPVKEEENNNSSENDYEKPSDEDVPVKEEEEETVLPIEEQEIPKIDTKVEGTPPVVTPTVSKSNNSSSKNSSSKKEQKTTKTDDISKEELETVYVEPQPISAPAEEETVEEESGLQEEGYYEEVEESLDDLYPEEEEVPTRRTKYTITKVVKDTFAAVLSAFREHKSLKFTVPIILLILFFIPFIVIFIRKKKDEEEENKK